MKSTIRPIFPNPLEASRPGAFSRLLVCNIDSIKVTDQVIHLYFPTHDCCAMNGAIKLATTIIPDIKLIYTYSGPALDTCYSKCRDGQWQSARARQMLEVFSEH
jgi:hypothetical protein